MGFDQYDEALIQILQAEGKIIPFLDVVFGFLHRCTDFYHVHDRPASVGFPAGVAEQLVLTTFRKWQAVHQRSAAVPPAVAQEVVTSPGPSRDHSCQEAAPSQPCGGAGGGRGPGWTGNRPSGPQQRSATCSASDVHNGAARDGYSWSQSITDLTVRVPVPLDTRRARQVSVELCSDRVSVRLMGGDTLLEGRLHRSIQAPESTWSLLPGDSVQLSLEKARECWWPALLETEPHIDLSKIEAVKPWEDLSEEEQMKIDELRIREDAKRRGSAPVSGGGNKDVSALLREAWHAEGSPFKGQPYDPSAVQIVNQDQPGS